MGLLDWLKSGVGEMMVARPDAAKSQVVWKHPDKTIPMKSQLTVEADEKAVFFRDGKIVATMDAGRHTLDSSNLPFLSNLIDSFTGGDVFIAEVFFVNVREHAGVKFGGRIGHVEDPKSGVPVETQDTVAWLANALFTRHLVAFELASVVLVGAMAGVMVYTTRRRAAAAEGSE